MNTRSFQHTGDAPALPFYQARAVFHTQSCCAGLAWLACLQAAGPRGCSWAPWSLQQLLRAGSGHSPAAGDGLWHPGLNASVIYLPFLSQKAYKQIYLRQGNCLTLLAAPISLGEHGDRQQLRYVNV